MKIKFLATGNAPDKYSASGETIIAHCNGQSESFDLSTIEHGGQFQGIAVDTLSLAPTHIIRHAERDENGELWVTLCQRAGGGHWRESDWMDVSAYQPGMVYIRQITEQQALEEMNG